MNNIDTAAIESLRSFAFLQSTYARAANRTDEYEHFSAFVHMCAAALAGEEWAVERLDEVIENVDYRLDRGTERIILSTDVTRPDGAIARSVEL